MASGNESELDIDNIIDTLLDLRGTSKQAPLPEETIKKMCVIAREILLDQPVLLDLAAPIKICGKELYKHSTVHNGYHAL
jgi:serine/threonine-protein phosphatase PP1 catalytic subunit